MTLAKVAPEFLIDHQEAEALAKAFCDYARHTNITINPRTADLVTLIGVVVAIEGPRLARVSSRRKMERRASQADAATKAASAGNVVDIGGVRGI